MKRYFTTYNLLAVSLVFIIPLLSACTGKNNFLSKSGVPLQIEEVSQGAAGTQDAPASLHPMFNGALGMPIASQSLSAMASDPSGYNPVTDYDGDGIPNDLELGAFNNPYVSEVPRISTRIDTPVTMELRVSEIDITENHVEVITDTDVKNTIDNSMESKQYNQLNRKTTPYVTKNSGDFSIKDAGSEGYSMGVQAYVTAFGFGGGGKFSMSQNRSWDRQFAQSSMSEKTVFEDVNYIDNLNRNGVELKNDTVQRVSRNFRENSLYKSTAKIEPNVGYVRAGLYIANESRNQPVRISNVICTLSFRTPAGKCLPVKTFRLRNDDYSEFDQEVYGGQELGPYTIEVAGLNTFEVKNALRSGYIPQIHVVNYDMHRVENSNYNPGVDNLKIVEETAKARTALIKITGKEMRETYRVPAFDVDANNNVSPGLSLKKALFLIYKNRTGRGESWDQGDSEGNSLTVPDNGLKWRADFNQGTAPDGEYRYDAGVESMEITGNRWSMFSTYLKTYTVMDRGTDGNLVEKKKRIETIERIGALKKYNPFTTEDNPAYDPNEALSLDEFYKMKYWVILHNGRYYEGDVNDPIWAGERYEIILFDARDFNEHFQSVYYAPLNQGTEQEAAVESASTAIDTRSNFTLSTLWNRVTNDKGEFSRALYLGKVIPGDVVKLDVDLEEFRSLFNVDRPGKEFGPPSKIAGSSGRSWHQFNYTFDTGESLGAGMPANFTYKLWGGTNSFDLWIEESANALYYSVSFWTGTDETTAKFAYITPANLKENNGFVTVNRNTPQSFKDGMGNIRAWDGTAKIGRIEPGQYKVKVRAHGRAHNVPVSVMSGNAAEDIAVSDPPTIETLPRLDSKMSAAGSMNNLTVWVEQAEDAEYYLIDVYGPYNYGHGDGKVEGYTPPKNRWIGHSGENSIPIPNPNLSDPALITGLTDEEKNYAVPGVYKVSVLPVNRNCYDETDNLVETTDETNRVRPLSGDPVPVQVDVNRYNDQRYEYDGQGNQTLAYAPRVQFEQFNPRDVDLEVNFNEGSGWFRLKVSNDDIGEEDRTINCRYTAAFIENNGRVTIYFSPPTGNPEDPQNPVYNVFRGGAEEVDVYLRTVAKPEYRDSLWLKPNSGDTFDQAASRALNINAGINTLPDCDPLKYWIGSSDTDSTLIENYNQGGRRVYSIISGLSNVGSNDFGVLAHAYKKDFFFSPVKKLTYSISASLVSADLSQMADDFTHVDNPEYRPMGGEQKIRLANLDTQYGDTFTISWAPAKYMNNAAFWMTQESITADSTHFFDITTTKMKDINDIDHDGNTEEIIDHSLSPNEEFSVCVQASNSKAYNGNTFPTNSSTICRNVRTIPEAVAVQLASPYGEYGGGSFLSPVQSLTNDSGNLLLQGIDFAYTQPLNSGAYDIYDTGVSGDLAQGKYIRIVSDGMNIADPSGLNLTPVAKNLYSVMLSPPGDQCYIDPLTSRFVLPRPAYWSRMESVSNIDTDAQIREEGPGQDQNIQYAGYGGWNSYTTAFPASFHSNFGNCLHSTWVGGGNGWEMYVGMYWGQSYGSKYIYPFGPATKKDISQGTLSFWGKMSAQRDMGWTGDCCYDGYGCYPLGTTDNSNVEWRLISNEFQVRFNTTNSNGSYTNVSTEIWINSGTGLQRVAGPVIVGTRAAWHHFYINWDAAKSFNGKSVIIYVDNIEQLSSTATLPAVLSNNTVPVITIYGNAYGLSGWDCGSYQVASQASAHSFIDNIKWFTHVVKQDGVPVGPSWEYDHSVYTIDDALHPIYGSANGYKPKLKVENNGGVGYYYVPGN